MKYWDKSLQLIDGCIPVSAGCDNCWSVSMTHRFKQGLTEKGKFNGSLRVREEKLNLPFNIKKPMVWAIWNDFGLLPLEIMNHVITMMRGCKNHTFLICTKRPEKLLSIWSAEGSLNKGESLDNVYWGVTVENQQIADERIPHLLQISGKKFVSVEPMLGMITIPQKYLKRISQVICGGETGHHARPLHPDWVRSLRNQCQMADVPFFFKGFGIYGWSENSYGKIHNDLAWRIKKGGN